MTSLRPPWWPLVLAATVTLSGCAIAPEDFSAQYALALCERSERCDLLAPFLMEQCRERARGVLGDDIPRALKEGRLRYDAAAARRCIDGLRAQDCLTPTPSDATLAACFSALQGTVPPGEPCFDLFECQQGLCGGIADNACPSTCPAVRAEGEECGPLVRADCDVRAGLRCEDFVCVHPGGAGASCKNNLGCASGFVCVKNACVPLRKEREGCSAHSSCVPGLYCGEGDGTVDVCKKRLAEGSRCGESPGDADAAITGAQCAEGLVCKGAGLDAVGDPVPGTCARASAVGGPCADEPPERQVHVSGCQAGLYCVNGRCELLPAEGPCAGGELCRPGVATCDRSMTCVPALPDGAPCDIDPQCQSGSCAGVCKPPFNYCHEP